MAYSRVLRDHRRDGSPEVTTTELFFDLVYVFAVTQLSHALLEHLGGRGVVESLVLFMAVWWAWNYTAWATNWIDPRHPAARLLLVALMLISLVMSSAIPEAFGGRGAAFAASYVGLQLLRSAFMVGAFGGRQRMGRNYLQLLIWSAIAGALWLVGAFLRGDGRLATWIAAVVVDYAAPLHGFALPRLGRTAMRDWPLAAAHLAERNQLVLLIALGESILATGATFAGSEWTLAAAVAFVIGFAETAALWWIYFGREEGAGAAIQRVANPAHVARAGFAYAHGIMVAGVIVVAVAIDLTVAHPAADMATWTTAVMLGGPGLFVIGRALYERAVAGSVSRTRLVALVALACIGPVALVGNRLAVSALALAVVVALAAWATLAQRPRPRVS